ncbi:hypothetical protein PIIN_00093 [Serendipita indica DSM 11827]|uniref:Uncharacterized protein n=1 Tax=Serendipita indica (strain DSM 11827) TaxID=1109443 RepID=G4T4Y2_SERID|nr:hypothetical protein PIIN_00093 [Serendipita indica DSM 11827]
MPPGPPPPLKPPTSIVNQHPQHAHAQSSGSNISPAQDNACRPSTSSGPAPRRPLPRTPLQPALPTRTDTTATTSSTQHSSSMTDSYHGTPSPNMSPPPPFSLSPAQSFVIPDNDMPSTPSTISSGSRSRHTHNSFASARSQGSTNSRLSAISFDPSHPPYWAMIPENGGLTQHSTLTPEMLASAAQQTHTTVNIHAALGHTVASRYIDLHLAKGSGSTVPSYGRGEVVEGRVDLKTLDHIASIDLTLQGTLSVTYFAQGVAYNHAEQSLFSTKRTIYERSDGKPTHTHHFSFFFPETCEGKQTPLPPTWSLNCPGVSAEVVYTLRVDLRRSGFMRQDDKALAKVEYYPRNAPPSPTSPDGAQPKKKRWLALEINTNLRPMGNLAVERPLVPTIFNTRICILRPKIYASGSDVPYMIHLWSPVNTTVQGSLDIQVTLVKSSEVFLKGERFEKKSVIAKAVNAQRRFVQGSSAENQSTRRPGTGDRDTRGGTLTIEGTIRAGKTGEEMSWSVDGIVSIKYALRFVVAPAAKVADFPGLREILPTFEHSEDITLTTHDTNALRSLEHASMPAVGLGHQRTRSHTLATTISNLSPQDSPIADELGVGSYNSQRSAGGGSYFP